MRKTLLAVAAFIALAGGRAFAGTPIDQAYQGSGPYSNSTVIVSSYALSGGAITLSMPAITKAQGGITYSGRNCITRMVLELSTNSTFYLLEGSAVGVGTTDYYIFGGALGTGNSTLNLSSDHLGPLCAAAGNAFTFSVPAPTVATVNNAVNAEGFTYFAPSLNSGN